MFMVEVIAVLSGVLLILGPILHAQPRRGHRPKTDLPPPTVAPPSPYRRR
jgi:hypothetical protein